MKINRTLTAIVASTALIIGCKEAEQNAQKTTPTPLAVAPETNTRAIPCIQSSQTPASMEICAKTNTNTYETSMTTVGRETLQKLGLTQNEINELENHGLTRNIFPAGDLSFLYAGKTSQDTRNFLTDILKMAKLLEESYKDLSKQSSGSYAFEFVRDGVPISYVKGLKQSLREDASSYYQVSENPNQINCADSRVLQDHSFEVTELEKAGKLCETKGYLEQFETKEIITLVKEGISAKTANGLFRAYVNATLGRTIDSKLEQDTSMAPLDSFALIAMAQNGMTPENLYRATLIDEVVKKTNNTTYPSEISTRLMQIDQLAKMGIYPQVSMQKE